MPKTKLCKQSSNLSKNTQADDIMADFQVPDDLRKQLEYPAQQKKRQLAIEHAEKKLTERLETIKARLKADRIKVGIQRQGDSLVLQATLPLKPGEVSKDGNPNKQTKVSLGIPFSLDGIARADEDARKLGKLITLDKFEWNEYYLGNKAPKPEVVKTIGDLLEEFEAKYFHKKRRNRQSETTFKGHVKYLRKHLPVAQPLTETIIYSSLENTKAGTGNRIALTNSLSVFCKTFKFDFDFKGYRDGYKPEKRNLPSDEEIEEKFHNFKPNKHRPDSQWQCWQWVYGVIATYGLRPHEVFAIHIESFTDQNNSLHELRLDETTTDGIKTGERIVFPLNPHWVKFFDLKNVKMPKSDGTLASKSQNISKNFQYAKINFPPYNLRHAYAIRGHRLGIAIKEMADNMGHSVIMHTKTYQKYMTIDTRRIVYQNGISKANAVKTELTEVELLRARVTELESKNAVLKIENESLKALLIEHQLDGLLKD